MNTQIELVQRVCEAEGRFNNTSYESTVRQASECLNKKQYGRCVELLSTLPTNKELLQQLIENLKGKSVYSTLKKLEKGRIDNKYQKLKALSSLLTHTIIECEKGNFHYRPLIIYLYERIGAAM